MLAIAIYQIYLVQVMDTTMAMGEDTTTTMGVVTTDGMMTFTSQNMWTKSTPTPLLRQPPDCVPMKIFTATEEPRLGHPEA